MKKILFGLVLASVGLMQSVNAEKSGFFMGAGLGFGGVINKRDNFEYNGGYQRNSIYTDYTHYSYQSFEILTGYKQFFTDNFGLRYYVDVSYNDFTFINYTLNIDAMYNFASNDSSSLGAFLGLGVGGISWGGNVKDDNFARFDLGLNLGLRAIMTEHHSIEIAARVPFNLDKKVDEYNNGIFTYSYAYNIGIRYVFNY